MGHAALFAVSRAGLDVERMRVEVALRNLANARTAAAKGGEPYTPLQVVARFQAREGGGSDGVFGLPVASVHAMPGAVRRSFEPGHPWADAEGMVRYPAVDPAVEMMEMTRAYRAYEANVAALGITRSMAQKALEIGGGS